jgi:pimeloyl-ACP methyl ester carboxylesterase
MKTPCIYVIPGLGCTEHLFHYTKVSGYELKILQWPPPEHQDTLATYAEKFIEQIDTSQTVNLMGVSFGGMICAELSQKIKTNKVVLISSCQTRKEIPWPIRFLKYAPLHLAIPERWMRYFAFNARWILGFMRDFVPHFMTMIRQMPPNYFRYTIHYIVTWSKETKNSKIIRIHGTNDKLLWYQNVSNVTFTVKNGSHAMVLYQANEVNMCLEKIFDGR